MSSDQRPPAKDLSVGVQRAPSSGEADAVAASLPPADLDPSQLTPEEQMARFAKELKENDWGHQPC